MALQSSSRWQAAARELKHVTFWLSILSLCADFATVCQGQVGTTAIVNLRSGFATLTAGAQPLRQAAQKDAASDNTADPLGRKLHLVQYVDDASAVDLKNSLVSAGGSSLDIVADKTLLVFAAPAAVAAATRSYGALMGDFQPSLKLSPEAAAFIEAAETNKLRRRRQLLHDRTAPGATTTLESSVASASASDAVSAVLPDEEDDSNGDLGSELPSSLRRRNRRRARRRRLAVQEADLSGDASGPATAPAGMEALETWRSVSAVFNNPSADAPGSSSSATPAPSNDAQQPTPSPPQQQQGTRNSTTPDLYGAIARLVPGLPADVLEEIARTWPRKLAAALDRNAAGDPCGPQVVDRGLFSQASPMLRVYLCADDYKAGTAWLAATTHVLWVEPVLQASTANAVAGWITQTGGLTADQYQNPAASLRPYWRANLRGQGIVVGVGDSGLDMSHCYFIDDKYRPGSLRSLFTGSPPRLYLPYHRKVVQYVLHDQAGINSWFGDERDGHGTHVSGSIAGAALNTSSSSSSGDDFLNNAGTGGAPMARLSMFDFAPKDQGGSLFIPWPVDDNVLPYHYAVDARISSESWALGSAFSVSYLEASRQFDAFAWRNPDFVSVVAAGNNGDNSMMATVVAPATAKNVLTVGATVNQPAGMSTYRSNSAILFRYTTPSGVQQQYAVWPSLGTPLTSWRWIMFNKTVPVRLANPASACSNLTGSPYSGSVVLIDLGQGACDYDTRALTAARAGAVGVLFMVPDDLFVDDNERLDTYWLSVNVYNGLITRAQGRNMTAILQDPRNTNIHMIYVKYPQINLGIDSVPYYSSYGPLPDGRIKPDIVAPGDPVLSSGAEGPGASFPDATSGTCSSRTIVDMGTSMSTAVVSGHLALVRQYFRDGFYPTGAPTDPASAGFSPSGMLLKAAVIAGARSLAGGYASNAGFSMGAAPDGYQGWGRLDFSGTLPLPGSTHPNFRIQVADMGEIAHGQMVFLPGIRATGTGPVLAALVWHDYPSSGLATKNLVNDLDFGYLVNTTTNSANYSRTRPDNANNVERVELTSLRAGDRVTLVVHGRDLQQRLLTGPDAQLPQRWSVFVAGHFTGTLKTPLNPAYMRPQRVLEPTVTLGLPGGACVALTAAGQLVAQTGSCDQPSSAFTLREEPAGTFSPFGGLVYTVRESGGRCLTITNATGTPTATAAACNSSSAAQKFAFFRNPYQDGSTFQLLPAQNIGLAGTDRLCLRPATSSAGSAMSLAPCNEDDPLQQLVLQRPAAAPAAPPGAPPPPPPSPGVMGAPELWYPYPLTFRTDWYPPSGAPNPYDYDYGNTEDLQDIYDYSDKYVSPTEKVLNLDIVVSWTWRNVTYTAGRGSVRANATAGAVYGGDNIYTDRQFEIVFFRTGMTPPPTVYHVCVGWSQSQPVGAPAVRVKLTVFRGKAVFSAARGVNTSQPFQGVCSPTASGYVGTYDPTAAPAPSPPPAPPAPVVTYPYPLTIRLDWAPLSGIKGRGGMAVDLNLLVSWQVGTQTVLLSRAQPVAGGASLGPDNMPTRASFEIAYWALGTTPLQAAYDVCVGWPDDAVQQPLVRVTMSVFTDQAGLVTTSTRVVDTTLSWDGRCGAASRGYISTYYIAGPPGPLAPAGAGGLLGGAPSAAGVPGCYTPPSPSPLNALYLQAEWTQTNASLGLDAALYDWDLVVSWSYGGTDYELAPYSRFAAGGVHGGDNTRIAQQANREVVYWPTGVTGLAPQPATYHVCVRWHQPGRMNVSLRVFLGSSLVQTASAAWGSDQLFSKVCGPAAVGYVASYDYGAAAGVAAVAAGSAGGVRTAAAKVASGEFDSEGDSWSGAGF